MKNRIRQAPLGNGMIFGFRPSSIYFEVLVKLFKDAGCNCPSFKEYSKALFSFFVPFFGDRQRDQRV